MERLLLVLALKLADSVTTWLGLSRGYSESGVTAGPLLSAWGWPGLVLLSAVGLAVQLVVLWLMPASFKRAGWGLVILMAAFPVASNCWTLLA